MDYLMCRYFKQSQHAQPKPGGVYVDATLEVGTFSELLKQTEYQGTFIRIDQDETAI